MGVSGFIVRFMWSVTKRFSLFQSYATEMKDDVFYRKDRDLLTEKRTRGVQVNYNYKWDIDVVRPADFIA